MFLTTRIAAALIGVAALLLAAPLAVGGDFRHALEALRQKDFEQARAGFRALAELGHARSQYLLGTMYYNGEGGERDPTLAYGWIKLAADSGYAEAIETEQQLRAFVSSENRIDAERRLQDYTAQSIDSRLMPRIIPNCDYEDRTTPKLRSHPEDIFYPPAASRNGIEGAVTMELNIAADGTVRETRIITAIPAGVFEEAALHWIRTARFDPALRDGEPVPTLHMFMIRFQRGSRSTSGRGSNSILVGALGTDRDREADQFVKQMRQHAEEGNPSAQYAYATVIGGHPRYRKPWSDALPWIERAAAGGLKEAQFQLGESLLLGRGCEADARKAVEWLRLSAQQGSSAAGVALAQILARSGDEPKALFWLERASAAADPAGRKRMAAFLATTPHDALRNSRRALVLVAELIEQDRDDPLLLEIRAAARAGSGDFAAAASDEGAAIAAADKLGWDLAPMRERLAAYRNDTPWFGELLPQ